uniref:Uncharacterized protein n=1 Tax=Arundo donax TaxID=35708 RepID=A0A0A9GDE5_ARUDO
MEVEEASLYASSMDRKKDLDLKPVLSLQVKQFNSLGHHQLSGNIHGRSSM